MKEENRKVEEGQELEEGGWKEQVPLTLDPSMLVPPSAPHPLVGRDKDEVLVQGQESHCSGLQKRRSWPMPWGSLAEKGQSGSQSVHQTSLQSLWPIRSCPSRSITCILEGPPYPAQLFKHRSGVNTSHQDTCVSGCLKLYSKLSPLSCFVECEFQLRPIPVRQQVL